MSKLDLSTIIITALCIFALGFLIWKAFGLNNANANAARDTSSQIAEPNPRSAEDYEFDDESEIISDAANATADITTNRQTDATASTNAATTNTAGRTYDSGNAANTTSGNAATSGTTTGRSNGTTSTSSGGAAAASRQTTFYDDDSKGKFLVLAGAFRVRDNGVKEARRIRRMGYPDAEMTLMDRGTYATVLVDRFRSRGDAEELVDDLRAKGVESYVLTKR
ncbi:MAG: SPOR domain-containing protein [Bacteroidota bacterium]